MKNATTVSSGVRGLAVGRGLGAPGSGGLRLSSATTGSLPSVPTSRRPTTRASICAVLPRTQWTAPLRRPFTHFSLPLSVDWVLEIVTNWPDCASSIFGPRQAVAVETS